MSIGISAALGAEVERLRAELADLRDACAEKQRCIDSSVAAQRAFLAEIDALRSELAEYRRGAERYRTALEQIVAPFEDLNFVSGNKLLTYIHDTATSALAQEEGK